MYGTFYQKLGCSVHSHHTGQYYPECSLPESLLSLSLKIKMKVCRFDTTIDNQKSLKAQLDTVTTDHFSSYFHNLRISCNMCTRSIDEYFYGSINKSTYCLMGRWSTADRLLRSWVRIPPGAWMFVLCVLCVVRSRSLRRADHSSRGVLPTVACRCVLSRNFENGEAIDRDGLQSQRK
jgi:hypothetical protein